MAFVCLTVVFLLSYLCLEDLKRFYRVEDWDNIRQQLLTDDLWYRIVACKPFTVLTAGVIREPCQCEKEVQDIVIDSLGKRW